MSRKRLGKPLDRELSAEVDPVGGAYLHASAPLARQVRIARLGYLMVIAGGLFAGAMIETCG